MKKFLNQGVSTPLAIAIIVILIIIAGGAILAYQYYFIPKQEVNNPTIESSKTSENEIADWKVYNNKANYSFKYPASVLLYAVSEYGNDIAITDDAGTVYARSTDSKELIFSVTNYGSSLILSLNNIKNQFSRPEDISIGPVILADVNGYKVIFRDTTGVVSDFYFLENQGQIFKLTVLKDNNIAKQILSTFKFADSFTMNWQKDKDYSEHVGSKQAKFKINNEYTKKLIWPVIKNLPNNIIEKINSVIGFENGTAFSGGINFGEFDAANSNGTAGTEFDVNYDKNDVLSITITVDYYGAYPDSLETNASFNLKTGNLITMRDIFKNDKISDLIVVLNQKLQENIDQNPTGGCSREIINQQLQDDLNRGKFSESKIDFKIKSDGIEFIYNFGFPHIVQACEPKGNIFLSFSQLKDYLSPTGLLAKEIK